MSDRFEVVREAIRGVLIQDCAPLGNGEKIERAELKYEGLRSISVSVAIIG